MLSETGGTMIPDYGKEPHNACCFSPSSFMGEERSRQNL